MKTIEEIMGLVRGLQSAADLGFSDVSQNKILNNIESVLRELVERKPLSDEDIKKHIGVERGSSSFFVLEAIVRASEKAHGIGD